MRRSVVVFVLFLFLIIGRRYWVGATDGKAFTVNSVVDVTDANPGDGVCETAVGNGVCTLRAAIQETNALAGADVVILPAGRYELSRAGTFEDVAATGDLDIGDDLLLEGAGRDVTFIDANGLDRVLDIPCLDGPYPTTSDANRLCPAVTITSVTITGGSASRKGGGLSNNLGQVTIRDSAFVNNRASSGGAIDNYGQLTVEGSSFEGNGAIADFLSAGGAIDSYSTCCRASTLHISGSHFVNNFSVGSGGAVSTFAEHAVIRGTTFSGNEAPYGGAIHNIGGFAIIGSLTVSDSTFVGNRANQFVGGAIWSRDSSLTVIDTLFDGNAADIGGGGAIHNSNHHSSGLLVVKDSRFTFNVAEQGGGGAIFTWNDAQVDNSTFIGNSALMDGGGGFYNGGGVIAINSSTFYGNTALTTVGGGLYNKGSATLLNSTFSDNHAVAGGGIFNGGPEAVDPQLRSLNGTFYANAADFGAGVYNLDADFIVRNSIIAGSDGDDCGGNVATLSAGYNVDGDDTCGLTAVGDLPGIDPLLGPLKDNGGPTATHALQPGSPAIDAGHPGLPGSGGDTCEPFDQRGFRRPMDGDDNSSARCDIGAFEVADQRIYVPVFVR